MADRKLTEQDERNIKTLLAQNEMYKKTYEQSLLRGKERNAEQVKNAQREMAAKASAIVDADFGKRLISEFDESTNNGSSFDLFNSNDAVGYEPAPVIEKKKRVKVMRRDSGVITDDVIKDEAVLEVSHDDKGVEDVSIAYDEAPNTEMTSDVQYDLIPLPSDGECYRSKVNRVPVSYLTAYDENFITSPNLYRDGIVIDYLLKNKVMTYDIDVMDLVSGDADAIILFLRATGYGPEFPVSVKDPKTGKRIDTTVDLSKIKTKKFKLKGDENGYFEYVLPITKKKVKFKYLTRREERKLEELSKVENEATRAQSLRYVSNEIKSALKVDNTLDDAERQKMISCAQDIDMWVKKLDDSGTISVSKFITNRMEMQIMEYDGNTDRKFIHEAVKRMPSMDALKLRRYILDNEPGMDFNVEIKRPESLGGGSFTTFLEWDDTIFFNIA